MKGVQSSQIEQQPATSSRQPVASEEKLQQTKSQAQKKAKTAKAKTQSTEVARHQEGTGEKGRRKVPAKKVEPPRPCTISKALRLKIACGDTGISPEEIFGPALTGNERITRIVIDEPYIHMPRQVSQGVVMIVSSG